MQALQLPGLAFWKTDEIEVIMYTCKISSVFKTREIPFRQKNATRNAHTHLSRRRLSKRKKRGWLETLFLEKCVAGKECETLAL